MGQLTDQGNPSPACMLSWPMGTLSVVGHVGPVEEQFEGNINMYGVLSMEGCDAKLEVIYVRAFTMEELIFYVK
jgi:hypothetical protein